MSFEDDMFADGFDSGAKFKKSKKIKADYSTDPKKELKEFAAKFFSYDPRSALGNVLNHKSFTEDDKIEVWNLMFPDEPVWGGHDFMLKFHVRTKPIK